MRAFHGDEKIKQKYLERVLAHQAADKLIQGIYWENGKGCAVGCTVETSARPHKQYEIELGIPEWLARLEDRIFEGLPLGRAKQWPVEFLQAVNTGANLDKIKIPILIFIVESAREKTKRTDVLAAIDGVLVELRKEIIDLDSLRIAKQKATAAAYAAATAAAAYAAAAAAYAAYAAYAAATAAADAAYAAADAAADAAYAAADAADARKNEYIKIADKLLDLISGCN